MGHEGFNRNGSAQHGLLFHFLVKDVSCAPSGKLQQPQYDKDTDDNERNSGCNTDFISF